MQLSGYGYGAGEPLTDEAVPLTWNQRLPARVSR